MSRLALLTRDFSAFCGRVLLILIVFFLLVGGAKYCVEADASEMPVYGRAA
ncbi:hypothetical protein [Pandoraea apista]|uniref:Uncharacterized protein n=1 Tax=Pandoraea apista TaxID=93218 RepID=A0A5E5P3A8_9BURK|nr:hypothetical protein [Pandoraea apista]VVG70663.1 hypothetical protein PAP18089_01627 [Pandoraea apista]